MTKTNRCPRCGRDVEGDFCPNCDLHSTKHGVFRPIHDKKIEVEQEQHHFQTSSKESNISFFEKRSLSDETFSKEFFNKTVEEVIQETSKGYKYIPKIKPFERQKDLEFHLVKEAEVSHPSKEDTTQLDDEMTESIVISEQFTGDDNKEEFTNQIDTEITESKENDSMSEEVSDASQKDEMIENNDIVKKVEDESRKQQKMIWAMIIIMVLALIVSASIFFINRYQQTQRELNQQVNAVETKINDFYVDKDASAGFIDKKVTKENTNTIVEEIEKISEQQPTRAKTLDKQLSELQANAELEKGINALFVSPKIVGNQVKDVAIKEGQSIQFVEVKKPKNAFEKAVNQSIKDAKEQQYNMTQAKKAVQSLISQGDISKDASMDDYNKALKKVNLVKNKKVKDTLTKQLMKVKETIQERQKQKEEAEAAKKAEEQAKKAEAIQKEKEAMKNIDSKEVKKASSKAKVDPTNGEGTEYTGSAYDWAPGIQEKVIATCVRRGYVVEGGYELRPAYEYNGDGYYNLYGTNNNSSLLKGYSKSQLPVYLVTINCKTGWFKGNG